MQCDFVAALVSCVEGSCQATVRRFLTGLSSDELEFLAAFMGASILETADGPRSPAQLVDRISDMQKSRYAGRSTPDQDHKMILLFEFLCRSGLERTPVTVRAGHA
ncbi:MAG TPA: hypothetical protein VLY24_14930 [Bryobacteraceae bacterium]|nr:hypothetical protein [Bryobacteraceae bacterium]